MLQTDDAKPESEIPWRITKTASDSEMEVVSKKKLRIISLAATSLYSPQADYVLIQRSL